MLSISILISEKKENVIRCLESVKAFEIKLKEAGLDSELILIDTSKKDEIHNLLLEYTDKVYSFEWCNDFAKARNEGMKRASGEWFFFLDDDEWLVDTDAILSFLASEESKSVDAFTHRIRNFRDKEHTSYIDSFGARGFRMKPGIEFRGKIHEYVYPIPEKIVNLEATSYHSGYIFLTLEDKINHSKRNIPLLQDMMKSEPDNYRWNSQLLQEYWSIEDWENMKQLANNSIMSAIGKNTEPVKRHIGTFYICQIEALLKENQNENAVKCGLVALNDTRNSDMTFCYIRLLMAEAYCKTGDKQKALKNLEKYEGGYAVVKQNPAYEAQFSNQVAVCETFQIDNLRRASAIREALTRGEKKDGVILTVSLLISNRMDTIRRCLDSLEPIREAIPSELILVDTSKNPKVNEILKEYTNQVYEFDWCNDFAKARNVGIDHASGEWFLFLDDDEWFVEYEDLITFFTSGEYKHYGMADHQIRNFLDPHWEKYGDDMVSRLVKLGKNTRFHSKIHEYIAPIEGQKKTLKTMVYHTGYIYRTEEEAKKHTLRNVTLLEEMIAEEPQNRRWQIQIAQEYHAGKMWEELRKVVVKFLPELKIGEDDYHHTLSAFAICDVETLLHEKEYDKAELAVEEYLGSSRIIGIAKSFLHVLNAQVKYYKKDYEGCRNEVKIYFEEKLSFEKRGGITDEEAGAIISNSAFDQIRENDAISMLVLCDLQEGILDAFKNYYSDLKWNQAAIYIYEGMISTIVEYISRSLYDDIYATFFTDMFQNKYARAQAFMEIVSYQEDEEAFEKLMYALSKAKGKDWYIQYAKILQGDTNAVSAFFMDVPNALIPPEEILSVMNDNGLKIVDYWKEIPFTTWKSHVDDFVVHATKVQIENVLEKMEQEEDLRFEYFKEKAKQDGESLFRYYASIYQEEMLRFMPEALSEEVVGLSQYLEPLADLPSDEEILSWKKEVKQMIDDMEQARLAVLHNMEGLSINEMLRIFWNFAYATLDYAGVVYRPEIFEEKMDLLPNDVKAALSINEMFQARNNEERIAALKMAGMEFVELGANIKRVAQKMLELTPETEEIRQMVETMKNHIIELANSGMKKEAYDAIVQVRNMVPFDVELISWEGQMNE